MSQHVVLAAGERRLREILPGVCTRHFVREVPRGWAGACALSDVPPDGGSRSLHRQPGAGLPGTEKGHFRPLPLPGAGPRPPPPSLPPAAAQPPTPPPPPP